LKPSGSICDPIAGEPHSAREDRPFSDARPAENVVAFYNKRGTCEQWIKEGKCAIKWTRLSCRSFAANAVRLQLHALAYNLGNLLRTLATPEPIKDWSLTSLKEKLIKIGAKIVSHGPMSHFRWPKSPLPETCSPTSCSSSRNCGRRPMRRPRRRSDANNVPKAACAGDRGFETGQKTGAILENSPLNDSSKAARRHPLNRGREKTRIMVGSWWMTTPAANWGISVRTIGKASAPDPTTASGDQSVINDV
jgi:hypothetical protein